MKNKIGLWFLVCIIFMSIPFSYGESGGEGRSNAFDFVESTPKNLAKDVSLDGKIKLLFNKNVVNFSVKDNNLKCFAIKDEKNNEIPVEVIFADDQIEPDKKREIILKPKNSLAENTTYTIYISSGLQAKNGSYLDKEVSISFTTLSMQQEEDNLLPENKSVEKDLKEPVSTVSVKNNEEVKPKEEKEIVEEKKETKGISQNEENSTDSPNNDFEDEGKSTDLNGSIEDSLQEAKEDMDLNSETNLAGIVDDNVEEEKQSSIIFKKYIWIIILGAILGLVFTFRKKS